MADVNAVATGPRRMTLELLIHSILRKTAFLIAQLATAGGSRVPLERVPAEVFLELVKQLERQGVSRRVSADMFGLGLRTYQRKIQRVSESFPDREPSLWESVLQFIREKNLVSRHEVLRKFSREDELQVRGVLHELGDSRLIFSSGSGPGAVYRAASDAELGAFRDGPSDGLEDLLWALVYQLGPVELDEILKYSGLSREDVEATLGRLESSGHVEKVSTNKGTVFSATSLLVELGATKGWEAAIFDHFSAMVATIAARLSDDHNGTSLSDQVGGSTFSFDVSDDHPLKNEVCSTLSRVRSMLSEQRRRVEEYNQHQELPDPYTRVTFYAGQSTLTKAKADHETPT
jgi:hypothetical protein